MSSRSDGRLRGEARPIAIVYEKLDRADGSASFAFGSTKALASVSGPIEVRLAAEQPSKATFEVSVRPLSGVPGTESKALSASLRALLAPALLLSRNPRTLVQLVVQSLAPSRQTGTGTGLFGAPLMAAMVNAATLALLNAGSVPMAGVVCAVAVARVRPSAAGVSSPALVLDPTEDELAASDGGGCFAFIFAAHPTPEQSDAQFGSRLVWTDWRVTGGGTDVDELARAKLLARSGVEHVWQQVKESVGRAAVVPAPGLSQKPSKTAKTEDVEMKVDEEEEDDDAKMEI
ncbi:ribosomal protein S5 domain 2-like protein [Auriscalpium vulgare]|uniref:Ribosomal protein S5 domain 2-like protein n=1 Tax=Auriscalpium vulgare TaxID=40419 RepID=A0ACB8RRG4_9AGAM|nr:ribosomal protein S5 domain 2-like protein [Auriscalpium vulgare]